MIKIKKIEKEIYCQCTSCQCENKNAEMYKIDVGKTEQQTVSFRLCFECLCDFVGKSVFASNGMNIND